MCQGRSNSKRLGKGICDLECRMSFQDATVEHLGHKRSNHNNLLLCYHQTTRKYQHPFRFQVVWCTHSHYPIMAVNAWNRDRGNSGDDTALASGKEDFLRFNDVYYCNIFRRKNELEARLRGTQ